MLLYLILMSMCLTKPYKIKKLINNQAQLTDGRVVDVSLIAGIDEGDWILVNANLAVNKVSEREAKEINSYFAK